jgi:hypothetical protein
MPCKQNVQVSDTTGDDQRDIVKYIKYLNYKTHRAYKLVTL